MDIDTSKKLLVIVPYRDRIEHLAQFLEYVPPYIRNMGIDAEFIIVDQADEHPFNRAMLLNAGYMLYHTTRDDGTCAVSEDGADYLVFHDVDMIPLKEGVRYDYFHGARQIHSPTRYSMGGISSISRDYFEKVNGWSNSYWGWGGEDRNFMHRIHYHGVPVDEENRLTREMKRSRDLVDELEGHHDENRKSTKKKHHKLTKRLRNEPELNVEDGLSSFNWDRIMFERRESDTGEYLYAQVWFSGPEEE